MAKPARRQTRGNGGSSCPCRYLIPVELRPANPFQAQGRAIRPLGWLADSARLGACLLVLELIGALIKPFSVVDPTFFANMIAGHIVLAVLAGLIVAMPTVLGQLGVGTAVTRAEPHDPNARIVRRVSSRRTSSPCLGDPVYRQRGGAGTLMWEFSICDLQFCD